MLRSFKLFIFCFSFCLVSIAKKPSVQKPKVDSSASDSEEERPKSPWSFSVGLGALVTPVYEGDDELGLLVVPPVEVSYGSDLKLSVREGLRATLFNDGKLKLGFFVNYNYGRSTSQSSSPFRVLGDKSDLKGLNSVDGTVNLGGFASLQQKPFGFSVEGSKGVYGAYEGFRVSGSLNYVKWLGPFMFVPSVRLGWRDKNLVSTFFDITEAESERSGLAPYTVGSGTLDYGGGVFFFTPIFSPVMVSLLWQHKRLDKEIADSPLIQERGSSYQNMFGLVLTYSWPSSQR